MLEQLPGVIPEGVHSKVNCSVFAQSGRNMTSAFHFQLPFCCLTEPPQELWGGELCSIPLPDRQWSRQKQQSIEPSCIPLNTLCTRGWRASVNAINSTCSETILPQETGSHPCRKKLSCTRKEILGAERNCRRKTFAGWPSKMLPLYLPIRISWDFSQVWVGLLQDFRV